jgi:preprotein translocase subunit SecG
MQEVLLIVHLLLAIAIVVVVLLQRSEGGALGIGGGGGGGFVTGRSAANILTRATAILAACFMATSVLLTILASNTGGPKSILDQPASEAPANQPEAPAGPTVPRAE